MIRFLLVDGLNLVRRVYSALARAEEKSHLDNALVSVQQSLQRALREVEPTHALSVFEGEGLTWRHDLYPDYKCKRKAMPEELKESLPDFKQKFIDVGVNCFACKGLEADDVIATLAVKTASRYGQAVILSTDHIFCQLVSSSISVRNHFKKCFYDNDYIVARYGVVGQQLPDYWGLCGYVSNGIPGLPKVGEKTAKMYLQEYGSAQQVLANADVIGGKQGENIKRYWPQYELSKSLSLLKLDCELGINLQDYRYQHSL